MPPDSGLETDNASKAPTLDDAISAALGASSEPSESTVTKSVKEDNVKEKATAPSSEKAGDDRDGEDAPPDRPNKQAAPIDEKAPETGPKLSEAPKHWADADKQAFAALPDEAKSVLLKLSKNLEGGFTRKSQELSDKGKFADTVRNLFDGGLKAQLAQAGLDEVGGVRYLLDLQRKATEDPVGYAKWFIAQSGIRPEHLFPQAKPQAGQQKQVDPAADLSEQDIDALIADPAVKQLEAKLAAIEAKEAERERQRQNFERQQYASSVQSIQTQLVQFREAQDDNGHLQYPHFDTVQRHMGALMDTDPDLVSMPDGPEKLAKAYDMAVWARPDLRQGFLEAQTADMALQQQKRAEADKARRATAVKPAAGSVTKKSGKISIEDAVAAGMSKAGL